VYAVPARTELNPHDVFVACTFKNNDCTDSSVIPEEITLSDGTKIKVKKWTKENDNPDDSIDDVDIDELWNIPKVEMNRINSALGHKDALQLMNQFNISKVSATLTKDKRLVIIVTVKIYGLLVLNDPPLPKVIDSFPVVVEQGRFSLL